jgi:hypothetical protein
MLSEPAAATDSVRERVEALLDVAQTCREVDRDAPVHVIEITEIPASVVRGTADDWKSGMLIGAEVANGALVPSRNPVLSFGDSGRTSVRVGNPPEIAALNDAFTLTAWALPKSTEESYRTVLDKGGRDAGIAIRQARTLSNGNVVSVRMYVEAEPAPHEPYQVAYRPEDPAAFDHRWHHYAASFDGEALRLFIDGRLVGDSPKRGMADLGEGDLCFGCLASGGEPWTGYIADVTVWGEALPAPRIAAQIERELQGDEKGLVGFWPLDEGQGETAHDVSGNGIHGRISGGTWKMLPVQRAVRLSNPVRLDADLEVASCLVEWEADVDDDAQKARVDVFYGMSENPNVLPEQWSKAQNGIGLAVGTEGPEFAGKCLWLKQVLTTEDPAVIPRVASVSLKFEK